MLTEGFDEPSVSCIIVARPTMSRPLYVQMIGRGTRLYPGKPDVLILHLVAATSRLELVTAPTLFGLPPRDLATNTITAVLERREQVAKLAKQRQTGSVLVARAVNVLQRLAWVETESGFAVSLGAGGSLHLLPSASGIWSVAQQVDGTRHMLATGLDIGYAQGCAEDKPPGDRTWPRTGSTGACTSLATTRRRI